MKITTCPHCRSTKHERAEEQSSVVAPCDRCGPISEAGRAEERAHGCRARTGNTRPSALGGLVALSEAEADREEEIRADERARIRGWLGQQSGQADRESRGAGIGDRSAIFIGKHKAFKAAADYLKPPHVNAGLAAKRAARKAVVK